MPTHFRICCNDGNLTPDHKFSIPDGLGYIYDDYCHGNVET